jgi:hypothetical protein
MGNAHCRAAAAIGMASDAFVRDVQMLAIAVEERPQCIGICVCLSIREARILGKLGHRSNSVSSRLPVSGADRKLATGIGLL